MADVVTGNFAQVTAALAAVAAKVDAADETVEEAGANIVAVGAAARAPRFTGALQASVDEDGGVVIVDSPYGGYVEWGTRHAAAQPFLRPAAAAAEPVIRQTAEQIYTVATR